MIDTITLLRTPRRWCRSAFTPWPALLLLSVLVMGCAASATSTPVAQPQPAVSEPSESPTTVASTPTPVPSPASQEAVAVNELATDAEAAPTVAPTVTPHPLTEADTALPPAPIGFDDLFSEAPRGPRPTSIRIEDIDVDQADVIAVGVNDEDLSFEVPPADQVGWYEFGPAPGEGGSAVLAAHIAYNGVDGVFRYLADVEIGSTVEIGFDDGSSQRYRITAVTDYLKEDLPDSLFDTTGVEQLALITCGGSFNRQLDSYESNTVAIAIPV